MSHARYGALEAGGTKMVLAICTDDGSILETERLPTQDPATTLDAIEQWFAKREAIAALGVGAFGPVGVNPQAANYGHILETPKTAWRHVDLLGELTARLRVPVALDTDVNVACLGEVRFGVGQGLTDVLYLTIGTGIGAGVMSGGKLIHGMLHPEAGHIPLARRSDDPLCSTHPQSSGCPYHANCLEGLLAGPSIALRWPELVGRVGDDPQAIDLLAYYLGQALATYTLCYAPQRIIIGGGIADTTPLIELARPKLLDALAGYLVTPELADIESYVVGNSLDGNQGILGCLALVTDHAC